MTLNLADSKEVGLELAIIPVMFRLEPDVESNSRLLDAMADSCVAFHVGAQMYRLRAAAGFVQVEPQAQ